MDKIPRDKLDSFVRSSIAFFSEMGVSTRIFPLSCKDEGIADNGFARFRSALIEYIRGGLQDARDAGVERRVKNAAAHLRDLCKEAAEAGKIDDEGKRAEIRAVSLKRMEETEREVRRVINRNKNEILRLQESVLNKWALELGSLKDQVNHSIRNAAPEQLNQPNQLLGYIQVHVNDFLLREFKAAEEQAQNSAIKELNKFAGQLPAPQQEGAMAIRGLTRWDKNFKVPAEFGSLGMLAFTFFTKAHGLFSTIACLPQMYLIFVLSPLINKIFEQLLQAGGKIGDSVFKTRLQKEIDKQWPRVDEEVRGKITAYFNALSDQVEQAGNGTIAAVNGRERNKVSMTESLEVTRKTAELEKFEQELGGIL